MKTKFFLSSALLLILTMLSAGVREISFYCPAPAKTPPVIDGKLDDPCWREAAEYTASYEYFKSNPGPGKLRNSFRIVYDRRGLYLAIIHYEPNVKMIRKSITNRDNPDLWTDDCAEIYIDPQGQGIGFCKFTVNALGTVADELRLDGNVTRHDWDAVGAVVQTRIESDRWTIEGFFPWEDLGARAKPGDIWRFCHVRYAWPKGKFVGTSSSPGGNYAATGNFGYLCFSDGSGVDTDRISKLLLEKAAPPWCIRLGDDLISNIGDGLRKCPLREAVRQQKDQLSRCFFKLKNVPPKYRKEKSLLQEEYRKTAAEQESSMQQYRSLDSLLERVRRFQWKVKLENEYNTVTETER